jgi:DMSO/TMAO reductase YedYZ molybdopterin-dependent catalytic subunit
VDRSLLAAIAFFLAIPVAGAAEPSLSITGLVTRPLRLSLADLRSLPTTHVSANQVSGRGPVILDCTGVALSTLLQRSSPSLGTQRNANLAHALLITGDDGYVVALSLGEIDPDYGHAAAVIATDCGGKALEAPRLVVPGDVHAGRAVRGVVTIDVR